MSTVAIGFVIGNVPFSGTRRSRSRKVSPAIHDNVRNSGVGTPAGATICRATVPLASSFAQPDATTRATSAASDDRSMASPACALGEIDQRLGKAFGVGVDAGDRPDHHRLVAVPEHTRVLQRIG